MVGPVETPVLVEPEIERVHRRHRRLDVVLERLLDAAGERRQHEHRLEVLRVQDLHPRIAVLVLGMVRHAVDLHQRSRVDTLGDLAAEQQIQAARFDDRVEGRVGDEVIDLAAHDRQGALAVGEHLHAAALELLGQVPGEGVDRLVVVVVDVDRPVVQRGHVGSLRRLRSCSYVVVPIIVSAPAQQGREVRRALLEEAVMPSMKSGRSSDSCISFSARLLASTTSRIASPYACALMTASELGAQLRAMSSA